jgi:tetratricopeptide (TPR) repeat protein
VQLELARVRFARSQLAVATGDAVEAARERTAALALTAALTAAFPDRHTYRQDHAKMQFSASTDTMLQGDLAASEAFATAAIATQEVLVQQLAGTPAPRSDLATFLRQAALLRSRQKDIAGARPLLERAIALEREAVALQPDDVHFAYELGGLLQDLGWNCLHREQWQAARTAWRESRDLFERALAAGLPRAAGDRNLPLTLQFLAQAELMCDDFDGVVAALRRLQEVRPLAAAELRRIGAALHVDDRPDFATLVQEADTRDRAAAGTKPAGGK